MVVGGVKIVRQISILILLWYKFVENRFGKYFLTKSESSHERDEGEEN